MARTRCAPHQDPARRDGRTQTNGYAGTCGLGSESTRPEGKPGFAYLGADVRGINAVSDVQSWEKQAHNPVGVTSS